MNRDKWIDASQQILDALDIAAEYAAIGVEVVGQHANQNGWLECRAVGREDASPSAGVNVGREHPQRGRYKEFVGEGRNLSLFDFACEFGPHADWKAARKHYAERAGVTLPGGDAKRPQDKLTFRPWNESLAFSWSLKKPGVEVDAVKLAGGSLAYWPAKGRNSVVAFPIYGCGGEDSDAVGFAMYGSTGLDLPLRNPKSGETTYHKMLTAGGSQKGWLGRHGLSILRTADIVWKCEGTTDMLAVQSAILRDAPHLRDTHAVISNSNGSNEIPQPELVAMLAGRVVYVVHDADIDGQAGDSGNGGGLRWARKIAEHAREVRFVKLPYQIEKSHGKDVRDWLNEGHTYAELLTLAEASEVVGGPSAEEAKADASPTAVDAEVVASIGLDVLGETDGGKVQVFSDCHRKTDLIPDVAKLTIFKLQQIAGPLVRERVHVGADAVPGMNSLADIKHAIANLAGYRRLDDHPAVGCGVWRGQNADGEATDEVVIVGSGEAAVANCVGPVRQLVKPRHNGMLLDLSTSDPWYDFEGLSKMIEKCNHEFAGQVLDETEEIFARWAWSNQGQCPKIVAAMILSTWVQSVWEWRPQVYVTGASNTGKSTLFGAIAEIFGRLAIKTSNSTAAGIRQRIQNTAAIVLCDEFESSKYQRDIVEMIRASGRGDHAFRGTSGSQKGISFRLQHIFWSAAVNPSLGKEADWNRAIKLELVPPPKDRMNQLQVPSPAHLKALGQRLLAVAVWIALRAKASAGQVSRLQFDGAHPRIVESYAVPAACYATAMGETAVGSAAEVLERMLGNVTGSGDQSDMVSDEDRLIEDILGSVVRSGNGNHTVSQLIVRAGGNEREVPVVEILAGVGVGIFRSVGGHIQADRRNVTEVTDSADRYLFVHPASLERHCLKDTDWSGQKVALILKRISGAVASAQRLSSRTIRGVLIPFSSLPDFAADEKPF